MEVLVNLTIDGREVTVPAGSTVLQAAEKLGIHIPTFCHYAKLVDIGSCRMCLVEVEKMRGPQTACTTRVQEAMVVRTDTPDVISTRKGALEFLLTNHPLDCPVCDKGGECELQDQTMEFGPGVSRYIEEKRHKRKAYPLSPFIIMDEERCVLCRRCFRFLEEWAGDYELDLFARGRLTFVSTFPGRELSSPFSGNVTEVCPVGALTSRSFRFKARSWELDMVPGICTLCGVGCNLTVESKSNRLLRVMGRENSDVNDQWLCDRGKFGHDYVGSTERLTQPMIRRDGKLRPASWEEAIAFAAGRIREIARAGNPDVVAAVGSARASNETNFLLQKWARAVVGTNNVDFAGRPRDDMRALSSPVAPLNAGVVVLVGVDALGAAPIVDLWIRRAAITKGVRVIAIGSKRPEVSRYGAWLACQPGTEQAVLAGLLHLLARDKRLEDAKRADVQRWTQDYAPAQVAELTGVEADALARATDLLADKRKPLILYGDAAGTDSTLGVMRNLTVLLGGEMAYLTPHANAWGASLMGVGPDRYPGGAAVEDAKARDSVGKRWGVKLSPRRGLSLAQMLSAAREGKVQAMLLVESDLATEVPGARSALETLRFLAVQDTFLTPTAEIADVVFPAAAPAETDGTYVSLSNRLQLAQRALYLSHDARPSWQTVADLAEAMQDEGKKRGKEGQWDYAQALDVWHEITRMAPVCRECTYETLANGGWQIQAPAERARFAEFELELPLSQGDYPLTLAVGHSVFGSGALLAHSEAIGAKVAAGLVWIHPADAEPRGINSGDGVVVSSARGLVRMHAQLTEDVTPGTVWAAMNVDGAALSEILEPSALTRVRLARE